MAELILCPTSGSLRQDEAEKALNRPISVADYRERARRRLPRFVMDYLDGGAEDEAGLQRNREAFGHYQFAPRRLCDVRSRSTEGELFGNAISAPMVVGPTGLNGLFWPDGDLCLARAAGRAGLPFALSTASNASLEEVADLATGDLWFQLYVVTEGLADQLVDRAQAAGYRTLVVTVDVPVNGRRERDIKNGFGLPFRYTARLIADAALHPAWSLATLRHGQPQMKNLASAQATDAAAQAALLSRQMDAGFDWDRLKRLRYRWPHRLLVKGLMRADDVQQCFALGVDAVVLSNHGGRQLDGSASAIRVLETLPPQERPVLVDGGVRRGADVLKAMALGASAVMLGRAPLYGLAVGGEDGAFDVLRLLKEEVDLTLAHIGLRSISELSRDLLLAQRQN